MNDRKLPSLEKALDADFLEKRMPAILHGISENSSFASRVSAKVLKYKPGKTCVIAYELLPQKSDQPAVAMVGKMYRKGRAEPIFRHLQAIWKQRNGRLPNGEQATFRMAEPLYFDAELGMIFHRRVEGVCFEDAFRTEERGHALAATAINLAVLHSMQLSAEYKSLADHVEKFARPHFDDFYREMPHLQRRLEEVFKWLATRSEPTQLSVPVHADLNFSQIFVQSGGATFIDFDGFCLSHPALDVANFVAILQTKCPQAGEQLAAQFLNAYLQARALIDLPDLHLFMALAYLRRMFIRFRQLQGHDRHNELPALLNRAQTYLSI